MIITIEKKRKGFPIKINIDGIPINGYDLYNVNNRAFIINTLKEANRKIVTLIRNQK